MNASDDRLQRLEARVAALEARLEGRVPAGGRRIVPPARAETVTRRVPPPEGGLGGGPERRSAHSGDTGPFPGITDILGWGGAGALVLAAIYMIRLAVSSGWLTPDRQIGISALAGCALIGAGLWLRRSERRYASLLPAAGIVILYLATYGAHLIHGLIGPLPALALVAGISLASLGLGVLFGAEYYPLFAVIGSYSAPFLLDAPPSSATDLVGYFLAWALVFSVYSVAVGKRSAYLVAAYLAFVGFDTAWRPSMSGIDAAVIHAVQFLIFAAAATVYSVRRRDPMNRAIALVHVPALVIFYVIEYVLLFEYAPDWAPWIAAASLAVLVGCYILARSRLETSLHGAHLLLGIYTTLVLLHAVYSESVPFRLSPWFALTVVPVIAWAAWRRTPKDFYLPVLVGCGFLFLGNYIRMVLDPEVGGPPGGKILVAIYAAALYAAYHQVRTRKAPEWLMGCLFGGHVAAMAAAWHLLGDRVAISVSWGVLALVCLGVSFLMKDVFLGNSSLLVYGISSAKVFLFDLSGAQPLVRIGSLVALGLSLYVGGLLYRRLNERPGDPVPGSAA